MKQFILFLIFTSVFLIQISSCGNKDDNSGASTEKQNETQKKNETENITDPAVKEGELGKDPLASENTTESQLEMEPGLPADFPPDVPQYEKAKLIGSLNSSDGMMVTYESTDQVQNIIDFYRENMTKNGYEVEDGGEIITPGKGGLINWTKQGKSVQIVLGYDKDKGLSSFVITYK